jgi:hypothetical protein
MLCKHWRVQVLPMGVPASGLSLASAVDNPSSAARAITQVATYMYDVVPLRDVEGAQAHAPRGRSGGLQVTCAAECQAAVINQRHQGDVL